MFLISPHLPSFVFAHIAYASVNIVSGESLISRIRESPPQFENRIIARVYVRSITRSTMCQKSSILFAGNAAVKISFVACGFSPVKIDYSDYLKSLISRINEVYIFSIKYRYSDILLNKHKLPLTFCLPTGHFWATSSTPLSANGPLLGHLFGFDF